MQLPLRHAACPPLALRWVNVLVIRCDVVRAASVWIRARCDVAKVVVRITAVERRLEFSTTQLQEKTSRKNQQTNQQINNQQIINNRNQQERRGGKEGRVSTTKRRDLVCAGR